MQRVIPESPTRNLSEALASTLADAIALAVQRPEVIEALRHAFTPTEAPTPKTNGLTKREIAVALAVSQSTIDRLCAQGMPAWHVGDHRRFDLDECRAWLRERGKAPTTPQPADVASIASGRLNRW
jgi:excisionase family DNA binding protein